MTKRLLILDDAWDLLQGRFSGPERADLSKAVVERCADPPGYLVEPDDDLRARLEAAVKPCCVLVIL